MRDSAWAPLTLAVHIGRYGGQALAHAGHGTEAGLLFKVELFHVYSPDLDNQSGTPLDSARCAGVPPTRGGGCQPRQQRAPGARSATRQEVTSLANIRAACCNESQAGKPCQNVSAFWGNSGKSADFAVVLVVGWVALGCQPNLSSMRGLWTS